MKLEKGGEGFVCRVQSHREMQSLGTEPSWPSWGVCTSPVCKNE